MKPVTIVTGPNGSGKSNLYQAIALVQASAAGRLAQTLATEGGLPSATYAGAGGTGRITLGIRTQDFDYSVEIGPSLSNRFTRFELDPFSRPSGSIGSMAPRRPAFWNTKPASVRSETPKATLCDTRWISTPPKPR